ncbi:MAG TPA: response regulator [Gemmatimonadales bacterium]
MAGPKDELQEQEQAPAADSATAPHGNGRPARARRARATGARARQLSHLRDALCDLRDGDFSVRLSDGIDDPVLAEIADVFNQVATRNQNLVKELARISTSVGREGDMDDRARLYDVGGDWNVALSALNSLINGLVAPTSEVARVIKAVAEGDLSQKMVLEIDGKVVQGEFLRIGTTVNRMVDQLNAFAGEVTRVAKEVGTDGKLGGQARVEGVAGTWKDLTDNVNAMAANLTNQVRNIADVTTAVAKGDLSRKITVEAQGEILDVKNTVNTMVDQLNAFAGEVTRVAKEVGTEGQLGGQALVEGVAGTWKDLTDNVNAMAANLTNQVRNIADVTTAVARGDLSRKITVEAQGEILDVKNTVNTMVDQLNAFAGEVTRVAREVGTDGVLGGQANVPGVAGTWKDLTESVNAMAANLTNQVRNIADVTTAVAKGDLSRKITVEAQGEIRELKNTVNTMVDQLNAFSGEVTRVAREVGTEGKLGGQARVEGVAGTWKDLTDNVNYMASNLTSQVRAIALVTTAVANGDLSQKVGVDVRGEMRELKDTINTMVDRLRNFADEVTRVAKEVGTEGKLGGQAEVEGVAGTWKALTDNVNQLANNLTVQVRAIAEVATAVTRGDLSRQITVTAAGELDELKGNINQMIANLKGTTEKNAEQDWLKTNLAKFSRIMQGQKNLEDVSRLIMSELTPLVGAHHGAFFISDTDEREPAFRLLASYAYKSRKHLANRFHLGEGLVGQAALEKKPILLTNVPDDYVQINSGLGEAAPRNIIVLPILFEGRVKAVVELASFGPFSDIHQTFLDQLQESIGVVLNMIVANMRTEELLLQSQKLTQELQNQSQELQEQQDELKRSNTELEAQARSLKQSQELLRDQQEELQQVNEELEEKAALLAEQNRKVEQKNSEVESARVALEEKAAQLALSSKYKSEFLANMSHELRTPLNSLLILARLLAENKESTLSSKQVEYAQTILGAGTDLLALINDVLDLSKVEAGKMEVLPAEVRIADVEAFVERGFRPLAEEKGLTFSTEVHPDVPSVLVTDGQRLQQVLRNLVSNAVKFTDEGGVTLTVRVAEQGRRFGNPTLDGAEKVIAFAVSDTGIGVARDKQRLIFEAFQQADGTTSRKYGGTGLGLSISREIARLLGGEIRVESTPGSGSTFTLFLPLRLDDPSAPGGGDQGGGGDGGLRVRRPSGPVLRVPGGTGGAGRPAMVEDDRDALSEGDRVLLVIEDDATFAGVLRDMAREHGFRSVVALDGEEGLQLARDLLPDAVTLDMDMPGTDGWQVLERLKSSPDTRHIPVHIISGSDGRQQGLRAGAIAYLEKPVDQSALAEVFDRIGQFIDRSVRSLLVVEDDEAQRKSIVELVGEDDVDIIAVGTAEEALRVLDERHVDCMVLDLGLEDMSGFELLERVKEDAAHQYLPIIIYTGKELSRQEETRLRKYAETIIVKDVKSPERLLDETALFLHRVESRLPEPKRRMLERLHDADAVFAGKKILIVDDDVRNVFSLTSVLEAHGMEVSFSESGRDALAQLDAGRTPDLVLMDVMMPDMDGYETTRAIRERPEFRSLPIIALTAKAMKGDREKCIEAGASDYVTKPVEVEQLLSLMRVWLYR